MRLSDYVERDLEILTTVARGRWSHARRALAHHIRSQKPMIEAMIATLTPPSPSPWAAREARTS